MRLDLIKDVVIDPTDGRTIERIEDAVVEIQTVLVDEQEEDLHL